MYKSQAQSQEVQYKRQSNEQVLISSASPVHSTAYHHRHPPPTRLLQFLLSRMSCPPQLWHMFSTLAYTLASAIPIKSLLNVHQDCHACQLGKHAHATPTSSQ
ncbi:hypothetical protein Leryth_019799 [Lithospermum erythrorhizon]|nr:hypothetical protein Leryth_019799 [Lithospermum erythrorhizon]